VKPFHRAGSGEPLVLVHGFANSWRVWEPVLPALERSFDVLAPTLAGHHGGDPLSGQATMDAVADALESRMDEAGFETAHIAGNSLGGWLALELARRGRARSVVCLAPAGGWAAGGRAERRLAFLFRLGRRLDAFLEPRAARLMRRPGLRKLLLGQMMEHGDRLTPEQAAARFTASAGCSVYLPLMKSILEVGPPDWSDGVDTPVLIAWPEFDRVLVERTCSEGFRRMPGVEWRTLEGTGHVPMGDDPDLVVRTIEEFAARARVSEEAGTGAGP